MRSEPDFGTRKGILLGWPRIAAGLLVFAFGGAGLVFISSLRETGLLIVLLVTAGPLLVAALLIAATLVATALLVTIATTLLVAVATLLVALVLLSLGVGFTIGWSILGRILTWVVYFFITRYLILFNSWLGLANARPFRFFF